jgi:hypothetical protein
MDRKEPQMCDVTENRFRTVFMLLRIGGVPANMKKPTVYVSAYNAVITFHGYALYFVFFMDVIVHRDDLRHFMKTFRSLTVATLILWVVLSLRYIK